MFIVAILETNDDYKRVRGTLTKLEGFATLEEAKSFVKNFYIETIVEYHETNYADFIHDGEKIHDKEIDDTTNLISFLGNQNYQTLDELFSKNYLDGEFVDCLHDIRIKQIELS
jgi:hypothetical protein